MRLRNTFTSLAIASCVSCLTPAYAQDGGAMFKAKFAACHGAEG